MAAALAVVLLFLQVRVSNSAEQLARAEAASVAERFQTLSESNRFLLSDLERIREEAGALKEQMEQSTAARLGMEQQFRADLESRDVTISELQGRLTVNILDRVLFDSGEARLKPDGAAVLSKVAALLERYPNRQVQVAGHTDTVPIRNRTADGFTDNWSLSVGRATAAVRYLVEKAGVDPHRVAAVGFGEHRPIAENTTPEGRARNRRIAVVVLPEEVVPVERIPAATNSVVEPPASVEHP
jgi:chemotaxis protein MotB